MCNINMLDALLKEAYTELRKIFEKNTFEYISKFEYIQSKTQTKNPENRLNAGFQDFCILYFWQTVLKDFEICKIATNRTA